MAEPPINGPGSTCDTPAAIDSFIEWALIRPGLSGVYASAIRGCGMNRVHESESLEVHFTPGERERPVVVAIGNTPILEHGHSWRSWAAASGVGFAAVIARYRHAFPREPMLDAARALNDVCGEAPRLGIGNSLWGHGMLKHARLLRLKWAIAVSPPYSVDPGLVPAHPRLGRAISRTGMKDFEGSRIDEFGPPSPTRCWTIFDPLDPAEQTQARLVAAVDGVTMLPAHHMGHQVGSLFSDELVLGGLFDAIRADDPSGAARLLRNQKKDRLHYFVAMAKICLRRRHVKWAREFLSRAENAGYTSKSRAFDDMMGMHLEVGDTARVEVLLQRALRRNLDRPRPYVYGARLRIEQGRLGEARRLCELGLKHNPGSSDLRAQLRRLGD